MALPTGWSIVTGAAPNTWTIMFDRTHYQAAHGNIDKKSRDFTSCVHWHRTREGAERCARQKWPSAGRPSVARVSTRQKPAK